MPAMRPRPSPNWKRGAGGTPAAAQLLLGQPYSAAGRAGEARERLETGLRQDPNNAPALYLYGDLSMDAGQTLDTVTAYAAAVKLDPGARATHPKIEEAVKAAFDAG